MRSPTAIQINHEGHFLYIYIRDKCTHYCVGGNISAGFRTNEALCLLSGADPGFQVRGGVLKKIASSGGRREKFWGISCEKSRFYAKKILLFPILGGGARRVRPPPGSTPGYVMRPLTWALKEVDPVGLHRQSGIHAQKI